MILQQVRSVQAPTIHYQATIGAAITRMQELKRNVLLVIDGEGKTYGIITKDKILDLYINGVGPAVNIEKFVTDQYSVAQETDTLMDVINSSDRDVIVVLDTQKKPKDVLTKQEIINVLIRYFSVDSHQQYEQYSPDENNKKMYSYHINLSEAYEILNHLASSYMEAAQIIDYSPDSIYVTDGEGKALRVNKAFEEITGIKKEIVLGKYGHELEMDNIFSPALTPIIIKEKRKITIFQIIDQKKQAIVTGVPIFNRKGEIFRVVLNSKSIEDLQLANKFIASKEKELNQETNDGKSNENNIVYASQQFEDTMTLIKKIAKVDSTIYLSGESGVGKSFLARSIHRFSKRRNEKFVDVSCGAIPESLLESELFGYEGGAFTGAKKSGKPGLIETANRGTLFLDEIGEMPLSLQVKLLQVIQERQATRIGGTEPVDLDVRIVVATNCDLKEMVLKGKFREDLYYRLNVVPIKILPIRQRKEDIIPLVKHFLQKYTEKYQRHLEFLNEAYEEMKNYNWFGNVREIENFIERLVVTNYSGVATKRDVIENLLDEDGLKQQAVVVNRLVQLRLAQEEVERKLIKMAYKEFSNSYKIAEVLGISQSGAHRKIQKYIMSEKR